MVKNISKIKRIAREYKGVLEQNHIRVQKIILYGSYAKGNPKPYSDIDLIIVSSDLVHFPPLKRQELLAQLSMNIDAPLEILGYTPKELKNSGQTIFGQIIRKTGKLLNC